MNIKTHQEGEIKIAEVISDEVLINNTEDALQILGDLYYQGFDKIILHEKQIIADFFDLKTGIAGEILQKFSNYRVQLFLVGEFSKYTDNSKSIRDFIYESNKGKQINFLSSVEQAIDLLSR